MRIINQIFDKYWNWMTIAGWITITYYSIYPLPKLPPIRSTDDSILHMIAYMIVAFPVSYVKPPRHISILLALIFWSLALELIQPYVNRYGELKDFIANLGGVVFAYLSGLVFAKFFRQTSQD